MEDTETHNRNKKSFKVYLPAAGRTASGRGVGSDTEDKERERDTVIENIKDTAFIISYHRNIVGYCRNSSVTVKQILRMQLAHL